MTITQPSRVAHSQKKRDRKKAAYYVNPSIDLRKATFADVLQALELPDHLFSHI